MGKNNETAAATAIDILLKHGVPDDEIRELLGGRIPHWKRGCDAEVWRRFGDGRDLDGLIASERQAERERASRHDEEVRTDIYLLSHEVFRGHTREQVEDVYNGPVDPELWQKAVERAARDLPDPSRFVDGATDMLHDIERVDREMEERGVDPGGWPGVLRDWKFGRLQNENLAVKVDDRTPPEVLRALEVLGVRTVRRAG